MIIIRNVLWDINFESENININREFLLHFETKKIKIKRGCIGKCRETQRNILLIKFGQGRIF